MNMAHLLNELGGGDKFEIDLENEVVKGLVVSHDGAVRWRPPDQRPAPIEVEAGGVSPSTPKVVTKSKPAYDMFIQFMFVDLLQHAEFNTAIQQL